MKLGTSIFVALMLLVAACVVWVLHVEFMLLHKRRQEGSVVASLHPDDDIVPQHHHHRNRRAQNRHSAHNETGAEPHRHNHHFNMSANHRHLRSHYGDMSRLGERGASAIATMGGKVAFAVVVSNEEFVDGALTLGWSFRNHSSLYRDGRAELVLITPRGKICNESLERLAAVGWRDQQLVPDLTPDAGSSVWAATFNKLYLFGLTSYKRVAYFDVDMLMLRSPDDVFATQLPDDSYIGALGNSPKKHKPYFQTGMMLIIPSQDAFETMMHDFRSHSEHRSVNGRDGVIVRRYYKERYVNLDNRLSAHLPPDEALDNVIGFHFRGSWKPWFDRSLPLLVDARKGTTHEREIGEAYFLWWFTYEDLHRRVLSTRRMDDAPAGYDPTRFTWLMRHTTQSYMQRLSAERDASTDLGSAQLSDMLSQLVGGDGQSCDSVCQSKQSSCDEATLHNPRFNSCDNMRRAFGCERCNPFVPHAAFPAYDIGSRRCHANPLIDPTALPRCGEYRTLHRRLCPCLPNVVRSKVSPCNTSISSWSSTDSDCRRYLSNLSNIIDARLAPSSPSQGVTVKLMAYFDDGVTRAMIKFPQLGFPHEAQSEIASYHVDRSLHTMLIPPTSPLWVSVEWLVAALLKTPQGEQRYSSELGSHLNATEIVIGFSNTHAETRRNNRVTGSTEIGASIQLWVPNVQPLDSLIPLAGNITQWPELPSVATLITTTLPTLGSLFLLDFVIGNDDRLPTRNTFLIRACGACRGEPSQQRQSLHVIALDQGHAFYDVTEMAFNPLVIAMRQPVGTEGVQAFCSIHGDIMKRMKDMSGAIVTPEEESRDDTHDDTNQEDGLISTLRFRLIGDDAANVITVIGEAALSRAQRRLDEAVRWYASRCAGSGHRKPFPSS